MPIKVRTGGAWVQVSDGVDGNDGVDGSGGTTIPVGTIVMYNQWAAPSGWAICNGQNGTPDLRDKFIIGASDGGNDTSFPGLSVNATGGSANSVVVAHNHGAGSYATDTKGAHTHTHGRLNSTSSYTRGIPIGSGGAAGSSFGTQTTGSAGSHAHTFNGTTSANNGQTGSGSGDGWAVSRTDKNLPPYYALCYIMKT